MTDLKASTASAPTCVRTTRDYDDDDLTGPNFIDHFSLREPSSTVKFRGARVHVYETLNEQILLEDRRSSRDKTLGDAAEEDDYDNGKGRQHRHNVTVKRMPWGNFGVVVLRTAYALIALLLFGFAFALSFQIILFLFVKLAAEGRAANAEYNDENATEEGIAILTFQLVSTILSTPVLLFGFSSLMAIATTFVSEAWSGGHLIRAVIGAPTILKEILYFVFFILTPATTFLVSLFLRVETPWEYACYAWIVAVATLFGIFGLAIVWCEVAACFRLISIHYGEDGDVNKLRKLILYIRRAILLVQTQKYSGTKQEQYLVSGDDEPPEGGYTFSENHEPSSVSHSLYTRITQLGCCGCMFETLDQPKRTYSIEEVRDVLPFITSHSWSLERMFCTSKRQRKIITAKGPASLERSQILASAACNIVGTVLIIVAVISFLFWLQTGVQSYIFVGVLSFFCCLLPLVKSNIAIVQMYSDINAEEKLVDEEMDGEDKEEDEDEDAKMYDETTMFRLWESSRVTQPKVWVCYTGMALEFVFLFLWPMTTLFTVGNWPIGIVFIVMAFFSFLRKYFDASAILCELGSMDKIDIRKRQGEESKSKISCLKRQKALKGVETTLIRKARLADIVGHISRSDTVTRWMWFFGGLVMFTCFLYSSAVASGDGLGERPPIVMVSDFQYVGEKSLQYPSCDMSKGFRIEFNGTTMDTPLGDYAFYSAMAYETTNVTSYLLPQWYGAEGVAVDEDALVKEYREEEGNSNTPVFFKFFTFPDAPQVGLVSIRGSQTSWDWMVNLQLWSAAGLAQFVKWITPYGWIWTPILDDLVWFIGMIQTEDLDKVSYYKVTTAFAKEFSTKYESIHVTGASLGGGLAVITGAQARVPAVAISGLGAELSRHTLQPPITKDDINKYVYNFIPDRDYVARVGGRPRQSQEAQCNASFSNLFGCHSMWRSVCEIAYRCGTDGRPVICRCHFNFGYPEPEPIGDTTRSFRQACFEEEEAFLAGTGSTVRSGWFEEGEFDL